MGNCPLPSYPPLGQLWFRYRAYVLWGGEMMDGGLGRLRRRRVEILLALVAVGVAALPVAGQDRDPQTRVWFGLGLGPLAARGLKVNTGLSFEFAVERAPHRFEARGLALIDVNSDLGIDNVEEIGVLYGRMAATSWGHAAVGAGLASVRSNPCVEGGGRGCTTVGIPLVAEAGLEANVIGLSLQAFGDLNPKHVFGGVIISLHLGWMP